MKNNICHISTVHSRFDDRIFLKECVSLSKTYNVFYIVADGKGDEVVSNVNITDIGLRQDSRLNRVKIDAKKALQKAVSLKCSIYHFHDPELLTIAKKLKSIGAKVIYDVHEDLPRQIYGKPYLNSFAKPIMSKTIEFYEDRIAKTLDYIFAATPFIADRFRKVNKNTTDIKNYPLLEENTSPTDFYSKENEICYVGGISEYRGIFELIESLKYSKIRLNLAGSFDDEDFETKCKKSDGWKYVNYYGFVSRKEIANILNRSKIGLVTLHPLVNYLDSLPVKMFEYMLAGIPVIASDFPFWVEIVNDNNCGINVNPLNPQSIANAVLKLINDDESMIKMGIAGRKVVMDKYNWEAEQIRILSIYKELV